MSRYRLDSEKVPGGGALYEWAYWPGGRIFSCLAESGAIFRYRVRVTGLKVTAQDVLACAETAR